MSALARFEDALRALGAKGGRGYWTCPAHEDRSPSLSVKAGDDGRVLVRCFAGCQTAEVVAALGMGLRDLFEEPLPGAPRPVPKVRKRPEPREIRGRIGLPTWDDLFWRQPDAAIDAHFAALGDPPDDTEVAAWLDRRHAAESREVSS